MASLHSESFRAAMMADEGREGKNRVIKIKTERARVFIALGNVLNK